jgi:hypothetical protein
MSYYLDPVSIIQGCLGFKFYRSLLEVVGLRVPFQYIRDFSMFNVCSSSKIFSSVGGTSVTDIIYKDLGVSGAEAVSPDHNL